LFIGYDAAFDVTAEVARLRKELERLTKDIASKQHGWKTRRFAAGPEHIVAGLETTLASGRTEFEKRRNARATRKESCRIA